ncbi:Uncharacterised protein [Staphylococcus aureus]|nr:Uncharacterised protein [Staphylococcus aureus]
MIFLIDSTPSKNKYKRTTVLIILTVVLFSHIFITKDVPSKK